MVCGDRPSAANWRRNAWRAAWRSTPTWSHALREQRKVRFAPHRDTCGFAGDVLRSCYTACSVGRWSRARFGRKCGGVQRHDGGRAPAGMRDRALLGRPHPKSRCSSLGNPSVIIFRMALVAIPQSSSMSSFATPSCSCRASHAMCACDKLSRRSARCELRFCSRSLRRRMVDGLRAATAGVTWCRWRSGCCACFERTDCQDHMCWIRLKIEALQHIAEVTLELHCLKNES